jgi:hypothetical protein
MSVCRYKETTVIEFYLLIGVQIIARLTEIQMYSEVIGVGWHPFETYI